MKIKFIVVLIFQISIFNVVLGQGPIITECSFYQLGGEYLRKKKFDIGLSSVSVGASGENICWDFSGVDFEHSSVIVDTIACILPNGTPFYDEPNVNYNISNLCLRSDTEIFELNDNTYSYYILENDSLNYVGDWADNGGSEKWYYSFSDLKTDLIFPFSYNDSHIDFFESSYLDLAGDGWHYQTGSVEVTIDGYGKLITPERDTILNTVRVKEVVTTVDSNFIYGIENFTNTSFYWYSTDEEGPILQFNMHPIQTSTIRSGYYLKKQEVPITTTENLEHVVFSIFPNPSSTSFKIRVEDGISEEMVISIYDSSGRLVKRIRNIRSTTLLLDKDNMSPGIYLVEISNNKKSIGRKKLLIQ